jgi:hypothetical protein
VLSDRGDNLNPLKLVTGTIRPPEILQSDGTLISIEVALNGAKRCDLRAWEPGSDQTLITDSVTSSAPGNAKVSG